METFIFLALGAFVGLLIIPFKLLFLGASALAWVVLIGGLLVWGLGD